MSQDAPSGRRRGVRRAAFAAVIALGLIAAALMTGVPQHRLAEYVLSRQLGGAVAIENLRTWGSVRADRIELAGPAPDGGTLPPVAIVLGLEMDYRVPGLSDRILGSVLVDEIQVNLDARAGQPSNFAFLTERPPDPEAGGIDPRWLPERVEVARLNVTTAVNRAQASARGLTVHCGFPGGAAAALEVRGEDIGAAFAGVIEGVDPTVLSGDVVVTARIDGDTAVLGANALFERAGDLNATATARLSAPWTEPGVQIDTLDADLHSASLNGRAFNDFVAGLSDGTIAFGALIAEPSNLHYEFTNGGLPSVEGAVIVQGLRLSAGDQLLYEGDFTAGAHIPGGDVAQGQVWLAMDDAHRLTADLRGSRQAGAVEVRGDRWEKQKLAALVPDAARNVIGGLDFERTNLRGRAEWDAGQVKLEASLTEPDTQEPFAAVTARLPEEDEWTAEGRLIAGTGAVAFNYAGRALDRFHASVSLENVALARLSRMASGQVLETDVRGRVDGTLAIDGTPSADYFGFDGAGTIAEPGIDAAEFDAVAVEFGGRFPREADRAEFSHIVLDAGDGVTRAGLSDLVVHFEPFYVRSQLAAALDLQHAARWYDLPGLFGEVELSGPLGYSDEELIMPFTIRIATLGYGDLILPYRTVIRSEVDIKYDTINRTGRIDGLAVHVGEGTYFTLALADFTLDPLRIAPARYDLISDLSLAAGMGLFASVQANSTLGGFVQYNENGLVGDWTLNAELNRLVFPQEIAAAENVRLQGAGTFQGSINGNGSVAAGLVTVAGGRLENLAGDIRIVDSVITIPDLRGNVFGGRFAAEVSAEILEPGLPARVNGRVMEFDLARFTNEVQPPETRLTGIANATFSIRNTLDGLDDLTLHATSTEHFSLNRDAVRKVLESEALSGALGIAQIERTVGRFLGDEPQRPFDSAELTLGDEGDRMRGKAVLLSEKTDDYHGLNLTIDLAIDDEALVQTLQMLEQNAVADVHF